MSFSQYFRNLELSGDANNNGGFKKTFFENMSPAFIDEEKNKCIGSRWLYMACCRCSCRKFIKTHPYEEHLVDGVQSDLPTTPVFNTAPLLLESSGYNKVPASRIAKNEINGIEDNQNFPPLSAEPFLPPVETNALAKRQSPPYSGGSSGGSQEDDMKFRSLDDEDIIQTKVLSKPILSSKSLGDVNDEESERLMRFRHLKSQETNAVSPLSGVSGTVVGGSLNSIATTTEVIDLSNSRSTVSTPNRVQSLNDISDKLSNGDVHRFSNGRVIDLELDVAALPHSSGGSPSMPERRPRRCGKLIPTRTNGNFLRAGYNRDSIRQQNPVILFPENLRAVEKPRESLQTCFQQMESSEWEVTMQGLVLLVRLVRYHPESIQSQLHNVVMALTKQIRNLRSQVSRAACQAAGEMCLTLKRHIEPVMEELAAPLLHRSADTNKFLRADCNDALDKMVDNVNPGKAVSVLVNKGASHQNAIVRTVCARLLVNITNKLGPERVMAMPKETREKIFITGANLLTEGSLDTRVYAKQLFKILSTHPNYSSTITETIPPRLLRNIEKTLQNLK